MKSAKFAQLLKTMRAAAPDVPDAAWSVFERALRAKYGGKSLSIPGPSKEAAATRDARIVRDKQNGVPVSVIMQKYGLSRAAIYKILNLKKEN